MRDRLVRTMASAACGVLLAGLAINKPLRAQPAGAANDPTFSCIANGTKVRHTYVSHPDPAQLKEAVRIFENNVEGAEYPVGTILQMVPGEAMVKRTRAAFPNTSGWEFFALGVTAGGTTITSRGDAASNRAGTCASCHGAATKFDYVCERTHGCAPVPLTDEVIARLQASDPRCTPK